jgi:UDP-3-O-[3-hydroxymyristoyl] glucosamine N-acyltransferase
MYIGDRHTVGEIALFLGGTVAGNEQQIVTGINVHFRAEAGDLTLADDPETVEEALQSPASVILVAEAIGYPEGKALIIHPEPFDAYNKLTRKFSPYRKQSSMTGENCLIADSAHLSPNCFIGHDVTIGEYVTIHAGAYIGDGTLIEENAIIGPNTVIGHYGFSYKKKPEGYARMHSCGYVHIEQNVEIGALCTIDAGLSSVTRIGRGTKIDNQVNIGHDCLVGNHCLIGGGANIPPYTTVEEGVSIMGTVAALQQTEQRPTVITGRLNP